jgi:hypothetical protein
MLTAGLHGSLQDSPRSIHHDPSLPDINARIGYTARSLWTVGRHCDVHEFKEACDLILVRQRNPESHGGDSELPL